MSFPVPVGMWRLENGDWVDYVGRVVGLVKVYHWCGNDPVRKQWARVDLTHLLMYLHKGQYDQTDQEMGVRMKEELT